MSIKENSSCSFNKSPDMSFSYTILMVSINAANVILWSLSFKSILNSSDLKMPLSALIDLRSTPHDFASISTSLFEATVSAAPVLCWPSPFSEGCLPKAN